ncbi:MAG: 2Fe-2S iron-sulfur cluster-binding protein [Pseudomonadota bacterium]
MSTLYLDGTEHRIELALGHSLLDAIMSAPHPIATACGGLAACGLCRLEVLEGMHNLREVGPREVEHLGNLLVERGWRLACQSRLIHDGDVRVRVPPVVDIAARKQAKLTEQLRQRHREKAAAAASRNSRGSGQGGRRR